MSNFFFVYEVICKYQGVVLIRWVSDRNYTIVKVKSMQLWDFLYFNGIFRIIQTLPERMNEIEWTQWTLHCAIIRCTSLHKRPTWECKEGIGAFNIHTCWQLSPLYSLVPQKMMSLQWHYSQVPNKQVGPNKRVGWLCWANFINV